MYCIFLIHAMVHSSKDWEFWTKKTSIGRNPCSATQSICVSQKRPFNITKLTVHAVVDYCENGAFLNKSAERTHYQRHKDKFVKSKKIGYTERNYAPQPREIILLGAWSKFLVLVHREKQKLYGAGKFKNTRNRSVLWIAKKSSL